jgi:hypothetical protein
MKLFRGFYKVDFVERIFPLQIAKELQLQHHRKRKKLKIPKWINIITKTKKKKLKLFMSTPANGTRRALTTHGLSKRVALHL